MGEGLSFFFFFGICVLREAKHKHPEKPKRRGGAGEEKKNDYNKMN